MTVALYIDEKYVADIGTTSGWNTYSEWLGQGSGESEKFAADGFSENLPALLSELGSIHPPEPELQSIHAGLMAGLRSHPGEIAVISDGTSDIEVPELYQQRQETTPDSGIVKRVIGKLKGLFGKENGEEPLI